MSSKLPVIGKRYKTRYGDDSDLIVEGIDTSIDITFVGDLSSQSISLEAFRGIITEGLPDQEPTTEESSTVDKVQQALEELKEKVIDYDMYTPKKVKEATQNLVNAIEEQKEEKPINALEEQKEEVKNQRVKIPEISDCGCNQDIESCPDCLPRSEPSKQEEIPHKSSSLICSCGHKQISVYPAFTQLKNLECGGCSKIGDLIIDDLFSKTVELCKKCDNSPANADHLCEPVNKSIWKLITETKPFFDRSNILIHKGNTNKSIWKPISELSPDLGTEECHYNIICQDDLGVYNLAYFDECEPSFDNGEVRFCTLTDFINQQQQLEERITKLENK